MTFHRTNFGSFGERLPADIHGFVPTAETGPWELTFDHGTERTHGESGQLTAYGEWWEHEGFPAICDAAIQATAEADQELMAWRTSPVS